MISPRLFSRGSGYRYAATKKTRENERRGDQEKYSKKGKKISNKKKKEKEKNTLEKWKREVKRESGKKERERKRGR